MVAFFNMVIGFSDQVVDTFLVADLKFIFEKTYGSPQHREARGLN